MVDLRNLVDKARYVLLELGKVMLDDDVQVDAMLSARKESFAVVTSGIFVLA